MHNRMKISINTFLSFAVFASTCFIAGFFIGDWTAYDAKYHESIEMIYAKRMDNLFEFDDYMQKVQALELIAMCEKNGCEDAKILYKKLLSKRITEIESSTDPDMHYYTPVDLESAKELIK